MTDDRDLTASTHYDLMDAEAALGTYFSDLGPRLGEAVAFEGGRWRRFAHLALRGLQPRRWEGAIGGSLSPRGAKNDPHHGQRSGRADVRPVQPRLASRTRRRAKRERDDADTSVAYSARQAFHLVRAASTGR
jgi:hypothetical protein